MIQLANLIVTLATLLVIGMMAILTLIWNLALIIAGASIIIYLVKLVINDIKRRLIKIEE